MLSNGFDKPLHLKRKPSKSLAAYIAVLHLLVAYALLQPVDVHGIVYLLLWFGWLASAGYHVIFFRRQVDNASRYWIWRSNGDWMFDQNQEPCFRLLAEKTVVTPWFVILCLRDVLLREQRHLYLFDQLETDTFRRLRVRLKFYYDEAAASREERV